MEPISLYPYRVEPTGNRKQFSNPWHCAMKCCIKTSHLRKIQITLTESLNQFNLSGQMIRIVSGDTMKFIQQFLCNEFRLCVFHTKNHTMSHATYPVSYTHLRAHETV